MWERQADRQPTEALLKHSQTCWDESPPPSPPLPPLSALQETH